MIQQQHIYQLHTPTPSPEHFNFNELHHIYSTSYIEPSADYRVSITPKHRDSHILVIYNFGWNGHGIQSNTIVRWSAARSINEGSFSGSQITSSGIVSDSRHRISGMASRR
eukprot:327838_1